jgi:hypothetical protein
MEARLPAIAIIGAQSCTSKTFHLCETISGRGFSRAVRPKRIGALAPEGTCPAILQIERIWTALQKQISPRMKTHENGFQNAKMAPLNFF